MTQVRKQFPKVQKLFILLSYKSKLALLNLEQETRSDISKNFMLLLRSLFPVVIYEVFPKFMLFFILKSSLSYYLWIVKLLEGRFKILE